MNTILQLTYSIGFTIYKILFLSENLILSTRYFEKCFTLLFHVLQRYKKKQYLLQKPCI